MDEQELWQLTTNDRIAIGKAASFLRFQAAYSVDATESARQEWISTAEALTDIERRCQPQPAEDPDEWVIQDRVAPREGVDQVQWDYFSDKNHWPYAQGAWPDDNRHGYRDKTDGSVLSVRCRRRDLPKVEQKKTTDDFGMYLESVIAKDPQLKAEVDAAEAELAAIDARLNKPEPQPQKTRVRLWIEGPTKMVMCRDKAPYGDWRELHHDSEGFYVEGGQP